MFLLTLFRGNDLREILGVYSSSDKAREAAEAYMADSPYWALDASGSVSELVIYNYGLDADPISHWDVKSTSVKQMVRNS
jgi:hypothetical protein